MSADYTIDSLLLVCKNHKKVRSATTVMCRIMTYKMEGERLKFHHIYLLKQLDKFYI